MRIECVEVRTFLFDCEAGLGDRQEGERLVSHKQNFVSADGGQKEQVAEEQRPVGFGAATLDAAEVAAENPLPATRIQLERLRKRVRNWIFKMFFGEYFAFGEDEAAF